MRPDIILSLIYRYVLYETFIVMSSFRRYKWPCSNRTVTLIVEPWPGHTILPTLRTYRGRLHRLLTSVYSTTTWFLSVKVLVLPGNVVLSKVYMSPLFVTTNLFVYVPFFLFSYIVFVFTFLWKRIRYKKVYIYFLFSVIRTFVKIELERKKTES